MNNINIKIKDQEYTPIKAHQSDAGFDLKAFGNYTIEPGETVVVDTGCAIQLPTDEQWIWQAQVRPRSGISSKTPLRICNSPGTIDNNFRGYIGVIIQNTGRDKFFIQDKTKIAQLIITKIPKVKLVIKNQLNQTDRGSNGFGSSGVK